MLDLGKGDVDYDIIAKPDPDVRPYESAGSWHLTDACDCVEHGVSIHDIKHRHHCVSWISKPKLFIHHSWWHNCNSDSKWKDTKQTVEDICCALNYSIWKICIFRRVFQVRVQTHPGKECCKSQVPRVWIQLWVDGARIVESNFNMN